jgi:tetratricopeptide (TPR) repeat protein
VSTHLEAGRQFVRAGRLIEAEREFERALEDAPDDLQALNVVALGALREGRLERAMQLLARAAGVDAADAVTQFHLGKAFEASGRLQDAIESYRRAIVARPEFYVARLTCAAVLERGGRAEDALVQYARALKDAQSEGRWVNPQTTPPALRPLVEHAVSVFRAGRRQLLQRIIEPLRGRYGAQSMTRVEKCLRLYLREESIERPDPRQQPSFLYFPGLPASPYIDRDALPWAPDLEQHTVAIRDELAALLSTAAGRERVFTSDDLERQNLSGLDHAPSWNGYYFWRHGERRDGMHERCPVTAAALEAVPLARVREHAPEVLFSVFTPGTHLLPHRGVTNTRIVAHLPLIVPADCALNVGGELHVWRAGEVVAFDDTYEHEAWNRSEAIRVVLILDVWNPHLTDAERAAVSDLVVAIGDLRESIGQA